jgi:hypothetical protein
VTGERSPNDIDVVLVLPEQYDFEATLRPFEYQVLVKSRVRRRYGFDVLVAREHGPEYTEYVELFQDIRDRPDRRKGILRVSL